MNKQLTGYLDDNNNPIFLGDKLKSKWGYEVVVVKDKYGYIGKLVCNDNHPCRNIPYALNNGKGYLIDNFPKQEG